MKFLKMMFHFSCFIPPSELIPFLDMHSFKVHQLFMKIYALYNNKIKLKSTITTRTVSIGNKKSDKNKNDSFTLLAHT